MYLKVVEYFKIGFVESNQYQVVNFGYCSDLPIREGWRLPTSNQASSFLCVPLGSILIIRNYWYRGGNYIEKKGFDCSTLF